MYKYPSVICVKCVQCRGNAEEALGKLNGTIIGKQTVRLSWGRNPANKQVLAHPSLLARFPLFVPSWLLRVDQPKLLLDEPNDQ